MGKNFHCFNFSFNHLGNGSEIRLDIVKYQSLLKCYRNCEVTLKKLNTKKHLIQTIESYKGNVSHFRLSSY